MKAAVEGGTVRDSEDRPGGEPETPESIGPYRLESSLGRGGMGEVFLAWDSLLERRVAIKRIRQDESQPPQLRERFRREARAAARLSHPSIVRIYGLLTDGAGDAIVMEYVEGTTLAERLAAGPLERRQALTLARQIAEGLAAAHAARLIHRDLKAENVIVTPAGDARILDFGLAKHVTPELGDEPLTRQGMLLGTYHAMSPEQACGGEVDERSDLFSFGALLYEMLTGLSPFRGQTALETIRRVLTATPPPLQSVRPDLPSELSSLLDRLLAKDREARPQSSQEVARTLQRIEDRERPSRWDDSVSELPTETLAQDTPSAPRPAIAAGPTPSSTIGLSLRRRPWHAIVAGLLALAAVAVSVLLWMHRGPDRLLRVALLPPEVKPAPGDPRLQLAASGVLSATLSSLTALEGIAPLEVDQSGQGPAEAARALAAEEVVATTVEPEEGTTLARVSLRRIQGRDGRVLWSDTFQVPTDPASLRLLADAVTVHLRRGYADHHLRPGTPDLDVRDEDYAEFLQVKQQLLDTGTADLEPPLIRLEEIARRSPRFLDAQILAARTAMSLYASRLDAGLLDRTARLIRQAKDLAPNDPRPLVPEFQLALATGREKDAEAILARMEEVQPGDPEVLLQRSRLAEQQGRWDEALRALHTAVERAPSWRYFHFLALLETQVGKVADARRHYNMALQRAPHNTWALMGLAHLELSYGDLAEAVRLYTEITRSIPRADLFSNLGAAYYLQGRLPEAGDALRKALQVNPDHAPALLNLADVESDLGHAKEAETLYRRTLELLEQRRRDPGGLASSAAMDMAACLARLGRFSEAGALAQTTLRTNPDDPELLFGAALVDGLIGDPSSALDHARSALDRGKSPRWFMGYSAFRPLLASGELQPLLAAAAKRSAEAPPVARKSPF
jgi:serine/threonine-protein kinase